jgi:hypothetical protein
MTTTNGRQLCERCGGTGVTCFKHIEGGKCFGCYGTGVARNTKPRPLAPAPKLPREEREVSYTVNGAELRIVVGRNRYQAGHWSEWSGTASWNGERAEVVTVEGERRTIETLNNRGVIAALRAQYPGIVVYQD